MIGTRQFKSDAKGGEAALSSVAESPVRGSTAATAGSSARNKRRSSAKSLAVL